MQVLCIGEVMLELSTSQPFEQTTQFAKAYAGDVYNTALTLHRLGTRTGFMTRLGLDPFSQHVWANMQQEGLITDVVRRVPGQLGVYLASYQTNGLWQAQYYRRQSAAVGMNPEDLPLRWFEKQTLAGNHAVFSTGISLAISSSARQTVEKAFRLARKAGMLTCFDINYRPALWPHTSDALDAIGNLLPYVEVLSTSLDDIQALLGLSHPSQILEYCHRKGVRWLILRQRDHHCLLGRVTGHQHHFHTLPVNPTVVRQPIGAGDAFNAGLLHGLLTDRSVVEAVQFGLQVASQKIEGYYTIAKLPHVSKDFEEINLPVMAE